MHLPLRLVKIRVGVLILPDPCDKRGGGVAKGANGGVDGWQLMIHLGADNERFFLLTMVFNAKYDFTKCFDFKLEGF